jgi:glycine/D-amino acid oxidase-like deaminating enzyme
LGDDGALEIARAGARAQDAIRTFARSCGTDVWWRDGASIRVSASPAQDAKLATYVTEARRLGVPEMAEPLSPAAVQALCASPAFRGGVLFPEGATVHPARLARAGRRSCVAL